MYIDTDTGRVSLNLFSKVKCSNSDGWLVVEQQRPLLDTQHAVR